MARQDQKGVVQIGIEQTELQALIEKIHISGIAKATSDANVGVAILDSDGNFISHTIAGASEGLAKLAEEMSQSISKFKYSDDFNTCRYNL